MTDPGELLKVGKGLNKNIVLDVLNKTTVRVCNRLIDGLGLQWYWSVKFLTQEKLEKDVEGEEG